MSQDYQLRNEMLVHGYIKRESKDIIDIPLDVMSICLLFYLEVFEILKFSDKFISKEGIELLDDNKCVRAIEWDHIYAMPDIEPVFQGVHCWRAKINGDEGFNWIMFGIGHKQIYDNYSYREGKQNT